MHTPVLLQHAIEGLNVVDGGKYIDATAGEGGHTTEILKRGGYVLAIDADRNQIDRLTSLQAAFPRLILKAGNFASIQRIATESGFMGADGILFDLGLSWRQLADYKRGLSYRKMDEPLDMRIDQQSDETARDILASRNSDELEELFMVNAEEPKAKQIAQKILAERSKHPLESVDDLMRVVSDVYPANSEYAAARIFQALRIEVNHEFEALKKGLQESIQVVRSGGRIAVITFHSREDRIVKQFIKTHNLLSVNKKAIAGNQNLSFERSAKLRVFSV